MISVGRREESSPAARSPLEGRDCRGHRENIMRNLHLFASVAVIALLACNSQAQAQRIAGGGAGGLNGGFGGGFGRMNGAVGGGANGALRGGGANGALMGGGANGGATGGGANGAV